MADIKSAAQGPLVVPGGGRLSHDEEKALNILLKRAGGEIDGVQFYKLGWALEDNFSRWDESQGQYVYDSEKLTPICFHPNQASYHLLAWEPPSMGLLAYEDQLKGQDLDKGTYNCVFHFVDPKTHIPISPTIQMMEVILPVMKQVNEIAYASYRGFDATRNALRAKSIERQKDAEVKQQTQYETYADELLESSAPAFEGNPFVSQGQGKKTKQFSDLRPNERDEHRGGGEGQPREFAFTVKSRKK